MNHVRKALAAAVSAVLLVSAAAVPVMPVSATDSIEDAYTWDTLKMGGAGFVSGIVTGQKEMYLRTDVGGVYRYDYEQKRWVQLFGFISEDDRGLLSCKGIAIDPTDDMTVYFLCGCAYFSDAKTVIFKTTDGGKTFTSVDVTDQIQVHGNGDGRECIEPIAVDPDNPDTIYAGGDVTGGKSALIKSTDGGKSWNPVEGYDELGLFSGELKYPSWTDHMVRGTEPAKLYNEQNGIGCIYIEGGKVYVGTSVTGEANIHVASVKDDKFEAIDALPNENYPLSITSDHNGNLFFTYIGGLAFAGASGGAFKYNIASGKVEQLSVSNNSIGMIEVDKNDPNKMFARTCGMWSDQWCGTEWVQDDPSTPENEGTIAWGDHFFRSSDGGETWEDITPGAGEMDYSTGDGVKKFTSLPLDTNGYDWIYGKACHWGSGILIDPRDPEGDRILLTSGNGVFACDNAWADKDIQFYFQPDGVEECVSLDFYSTADGLDLSAIGDYDGFIHETVDGIPQQYNPNMGSTSAITVCPQNTDVWARTAQGDGNNSGSAYYTLDRGKTWTAFTPACRGGKLSITELKKGSYRVINTSTGGAVSYSDDWGETWNKADGIKASKTVYTLVDPDDPSIIYASGATHNDYWSSDMSKKEPTFDESHYSYYISEDYGKTFKEYPVCAYNWELTWKFENTGDPAYLGNGVVAIAGANHGLFLISDKGEKIEQLDSVAYAKCVGYGAPEKAGGVNTLFIFGKPGADDPEGIYRSTDGGKSWVCINTAHVYGGTGNGNYLVGDMDEFGKVYMSTVGCGIVYGEITGTEKPKPVETQPAAETTEPKETEPKDTDPEDTDPEESTDPKDTQPDPEVSLYGDTNVDGNVDILDVITLNKFLLGSGPLKPQGKVNADVDANKDIDTTDSLNILKCVVEMIAQTDFPIK